METIRDLDSNATFEREPRGSKQCRTVALTDEAMAASKGEQPSKTHFNPQKLREGSKVKVNCQLGSDANC
jgi:hypothetical protein